MFDSGRTYFLGRSHIRLAPVLLYKNQELMFTKSLAVTEIYLFFVSQTGRR